MSNYKPSNFPNETFFEYGGVKVVFFDGNYVGSQLEGALIIGDDVIPFQTPMTGEVFIWMHFVFSVAPTSIRIITHSHLELVNSSISNVSRDISVPLSSPLPNTQCVFPRIYSPTLNYEFTGLHVWDTFNHQRMVQNRNTMFVTGNCYVHNSFQTTQLLEHMKDYCIHFLCIPLRFPKLPSQKLIMPSNK